MPGIFRIEQDRQAVGILGRDLVEVDGWSVAAPAVRRRDHVAAAFFLQQHVVRCLEVVEHETHVVELAVVDRLGQALLGVEAWPEPVRHHQIEVGGAAGLELVVGLRIAVEKGR